MMRLAYDPIAAEPVLVDACGCPHLRRDIAATIRRLERRYLMACRTPGRSAFQVAGLLERALAYRYTLLYLLDRAGQEVPHE
jgi:hypothetical protein